MKTATKAPPPGELRALIETLSIAKGVLTQRVEDLMKVNDTCVERRNELRAAIDGYQKSEKSMKEHIGLLTRELDDAKSLLAHQERLVITMRAEAVVHRARGYIAGLQGDPFEGPPMVMTNRISCDTADMVGGEPKSADPWEAERQHRALRNRKIDAAFSG